MSDKEKAEALSRELDAVLQGGEDGREGVDEEVRALSELGRSLHGIRPVPRAAHRAAIERLVRAHRADMRRAVQGVGAPVSEGKSRNRGRWSGQLVPAMLGALAFLFLCSTLVVVGGGLTWRVLRSRTQEPVIAHLPSATVTQPEVDRPTATPVVTQRAPEPGATNTPSLASTSAAVPTSTPSPPTPAAVAMTPQRAELRVVRGVVAMQDGSGPWVEAAIGQLLETGQRVRTGALSGAEIAFYDGSVAVLGPDTEVSLDAMDVDADGGRIVELTQWIGETSHEVVPATGESGRYAVNTPNGQAEAKGTIFHVVVTPGLALHLGVDRGAVAVTHLQVTVVVVAGQLTTVYPGQPPAEPLFRVRGEGEVDEIGPTAWRIAGYTFATHDYTVIVGNPQVGDWVSVEGHRLLDGTRVADRIALVHRSEENRFTVTGKVGAKGDTEWTVAGLPIAVDGDTQIDDRIGIGELVRVDGVVEESGRLRAASIRWVEPQPGLTFRFVGIVQATGREVWKISGLEVAVDRDTEIDDGLRVGDVVVVRGTVGEDDKWLARSIVRLTVERPRFEFTGIVERVDPWVISGIPLETETWTKVGEGVAPGKRVKVEGRVLPNGTWVADAIELADDDGELSFEFTGTVQQMEPTWLVSGITLTVDARTEIAEGIAVGDVVAVEGRITAKGAWYATEIVPVARPWLGRGCVMIAVVVLEADPGEILLPDGTLIPLQESIIVDGELRAGAIAAIWVCVDGEGTARVVSILVLYYIDPGDIVMPPAPPPGEGDKVTICHKPGTTAEKTMTVPQSAVEGHLRHGDYIGPCE